MVVTAAETFLLLIEQEVFGPGETLLFNYLESRPVSNPPNFTEAVELVRYGLEVIDRERGAAKKQFDFPVRFTLDLRGQGIDLEKTGGGFFPGV